MMDPWKQNELMIALAKKWRALIQILWIVTLVAVPFAWCALAFLIFPMWFAIPTALAGVLASFFVYRNVSPPDPPDPPSFWDGNGMTPPGVPVESALRVPVKRKWNMPEPSLPPL
jgi:energy-coupling factor transporter transmembrane protein EcfT